MSARKASKTRRTTRREVVKLLATTPLWPSFVAGAPVPKAIPPILPQEATVKPSPVAEALSEVVHIRYGKYLAPEQLEDVKKDIESGLRASERLRAHRLKNSDEPDFIFSAK